jgi:hypothetical protein
LFEPSLAPGEMVGFLCRRLPHGGGDRFVPGNEGLALIKSLGGDLARVVDAHESNRLEAFRGFQYEFAVAGTRQCPGGTRGRRQDFDCLINFANQSVDELK